MRRTYYTATVSIGFALFVDAVRRNDRLIGSPHPCVEQLHEARLVRIRRGAFAICLDPFGMLDTEVVMNLLLELGVGVDLMRHGDWLGERFRWSVGRLV